MANVVVRENEMKKVAVLKGGPSAEREVSLMTGAAVAVGLREKGYTVTEIEVHETLPDLDPQIDGVFIAMHGTYGEDGQVQAALEAIHIPYTGAGPDASRLAFDKALCKDCLASVDVPTAPSELVPRGQRPDLPLPFVIKPCRQGSTIGMSYVTREDEVDAAIALAYDYDDRVMAESYIPGRELTVGVVDGQVLPVVEVKAPDAWYSYDAKYASKTTEYRVPAPLSDSTRERCEDLALRAYTATGCRGMARVDFRLRPDGNLFVLEINTIPGFTPTSLLPKAAAEFGWSFPELCDRVMRTAWSA